MMLIYHSMMYYIIHHNCNFSHLKIILYFIFVFHEFKEYFESLHIFVKIIDK